MRPMNIARPARARSLTIAAVAPAAAAALALTLTGAATAQPAPGSLTLQAPRHAAYGHPAQITGSADPAEAGRRVALLAVAPGESTWRPLATTRIGHRGRFHFSIIARRSLQLRAAELSPAAGEAAAVVSATPASSPTRPLAVSARLTLTRAGGAVLSPGRVRVSGRLLPAQPGRVVRLIGRTSDGWRTLSRARTGRRGGFSLRGIARAEGERLRVSFAGDSLNDRVSAAAGRTAVFYATVVSWYDDAGMTGCGFHAEYGVASKTVPCGTRLTFRNGARSVTATVDDRGPYVGGRTFDLNQNTAAALGFAGVGTVWVAG